MALAPLDDADYSAINASFPGAEKDVLADFLLFPTLQKLKKKKWQISKSRIPYQ
jgi:hypothetical protein